MKRLSLPRPSQFDSIIREGPIDVKRKRAKKPDFPGFFCASRDPPPVSRPFDKTAAALPLQTRFGKSSAEIVLHHTNAHAPALSRESDAHGRLQLDGEAAGAGFRFSRRPRPEP